MKILLYSIVTASVSTLLHAEVRPYDGKGNNTKQPGWGAVGSQLQRFASADYGDGMAAMGGAGRPGPRTVSNRIASQAALTQSARGLSDMTWCWGQFLDHDISLVLPSQDEFIPVMVDGDDRMAPMIPMMRSQSDPATGTSVDNPRQQVNTTTAFIDASMVYGNSAERASALRSHQGGTLIVRDGGLLPWNMAEIEMENPSRRNLTDLYMAGDIRANENPALISMHSLWLREHNRWAGVLATENPEWTDEELYQQARRMVMGQIQNITFQEFLPALLGPLAPPLEEAQYDETVNAGMFNEVSGALYRIGHTMVSANIVMVRNDGSASIDGRFHFKEAFFQPELVSEAVTVDHILKGVASKRMQEIDPFVVDDLRNFLFAQPGQGGMDLISINLQRGRDHGVPSLNETRLALGLEAYDSFAEISSDRFIVQALAEVYGEVGLVDLWVGAMAEDHIDGASLGETAGTALAMQFRHLRDGDRFFFLVDDSLTAEEKATIKATTLADVIRRNTTIDNLQENVFMTPPVETWADTDRDGVPDIRELVAGTDPEDGTSVFWPLALEVEQAAVALSWASVPEKTYIIQYSGSLEGPWTFLETVEASAATTTHRLPSVDIRSGFYRVAVAR